MVVCSPSCAVIYARENREKKQAAEERKRKRAERRAQKAAKEAIRTPREWADLAQSAFNAYINERDRHRPCTACGKPPGAGNRHASHYRSRKAATHLRFNTFNVHTCCAQCNLFDAGNLVNMRAGMVERIGEDLVKRLEETNYTHTWDIEYYKRLAAVFRKRKRHLRQIRGEL